jgi:hypothetical protein
MRAARTVSPPVIDGRLNDDAWVQAEPAATFTRRDPDEENRQPNGPRCPPDLLDRTRRCAMAVSKLCRSVPETRNC